jgi:2-amino-4-hydroxy-6-hydroxymethyldihydropteridine diphosphokinase
LNIEKQLGRVRTEVRWQPRTIDIDILFYGDKIVHSPQSTVHSPAAKDLKSIELTIPHPRLHERRFVLVPITEIAADFVHPVFKKTMKELLNLCKDDLKVIKYTLCD